MPLSRLPIYRLYANSGKTQDTFVPDPPYVEDVRDLGE